MDDSRDPVPFQAHVELLRLFLSHRGEVVELVQDLLNAQRRPTRYLQDHSLLSRQFEECFFELAAVTDAQFRLRGQLEEAHWASGFKPRQVQELHNDLIHPAEMMMRAFFCWQQTRWPGRNGRVRYAHTLFNLHILRSLELLSMRLWDAGPSAADERLASLQDVLDELWRTSPGDQPVLVRDARWLIPLAQSPTTDELGGYFEVAEHVAETFAGDDRGEIQKAHVQMIGGHLRSQIRHYCLQDGVSLDEKSVVRRTRTSNALDFALLIQNLVPLLEGYAEAGERGDDGRRRELASAICQSISPDPELFVNRIDLLRPYSMIEHLFIATNPDGTADYTPMGRRHLELLAKYEALVGRVVKPLYEDCRHLAPVDGAYSPYGVFFGTPSNLTEHIAFKTVQHEAVPRFSLEDVFADGEADKLGWVNGWRKLPHIDPEVQKLHEYPHAFAQEIFNRIEHALRKRAGATEAGRADPTGRLFVVPADGPADSNAAAIPDLPAQYVGSSDMQVVTAHKAEFYDDAKLMRDKQEGHFIASYETSGGWIALKKDMLTEVLGAGQDVKVIGLPATTIAVSQLMCPGMVVDENACAHGQASVPPSMLKA